MTESKNFHYLQLDFGKCRFYEYNKGPRAGFTKHVASGGNESYRFYYDYGIIGEFNGIKLRKHPNFGHMELVTQLVAGTEVFNIQVKLMGKKGYDNFAEDIIKHLPAMVKGETYKINAYSMSAAQRNKNAAADGVTLKRPYSSAKKGITIKSCDPDGGNINRLEEGVVKLPALVFENIPGGGREPSGVSIDNRKGAVGPVLMRYLDVYEDDFLGASKRTSGPTMVPPPPSAQDLPQEPIIENTMALAEDDDDDLFG